MSGAMNYSQIWIEGTASELRLSAKAQDKQFQDAMRRELAIPPPAPLRPPRPPHVRDVLRIASSVHKLPFSAVNSIIAEVCEQHRVSRAEIFGARRQKLLVIARHEAFYRLKTETTLSLPAIGMRMGGKDHSTVHNGIAKHIARMAQG